MKCGACIHGSRDMSVFESEQSREVRTMYLSHFHTGPLAFLHDSTTHSQLSDDTLFMVMHPFFLKISAVL
ncbi:hypothetical protein PISMIDRAFT_686374 [Pisolithus microcarpus 441]|uniref:Uncharacterized protein n=1 Tax=Pisolithus microcarpus 441 TaxID=765257 RepID=A0A0C9Z1X4_9AGAM|nr:hypothetical protein PISMIDRAFT_686374 [Pisolithus microcarpus 441]